MLERILLSLRPVGGSDGFRQSVQPLVRDAGAQGVSVNALAARLRDAHGHAYRRADMLEDLRRYRSAESQVGVSAASSALDIALGTAVATLDAMPAYFDFRRTIARAGVVAFAVSLLLPTLLTAASRSDHGVLVAGTNELRANALTMTEFALPNQVSADQRSRRAVATPEPTPVPTPVPTTAPTPVPTPPQLALAAGAPGVVVTASWYGPGFFENRLPCWPWLKANGLPIQFLPDTWGVAHKTLPCGTMLILTHGPNTITVPVVDRGPYIDGREIDMSPRIKAALGCTDLCTVLMQIRQ
ncbi:MAG: septal ring lytic transglycosylase RlpA family protein [Chloroflexota bacterium]|nr:septal ring lytic transglycosylase RlpA family protein [Chloroflexota bacterium]